MRRVLNIIVTPLYLRKIHGTEKTFCNPQSWHRWLFVPPNTNTGCHGIRGGTLTLGKEMAAQILHNAPAQLIPELDGRIN